ncbi:MAG: hypothetical protein KatS3mg047_0894 [Bellilinea sp.]|nr:MAG: hypothetical protein KatS3mg047_0894 [Bellilinea sp.]
MNSDPIFIVGVQRSGTTLLSAMLAAHSQISCGPETHFFQRLSKERIEDLIDSKCWPKKAINFIKSITFTNFSDTSSNKISILEKYHLREETLFEYLSQQPPKITSILGSIVIPFMESLGKSRWAEKTPDHIKYLDLIRKFYPESPIIRIIRDPRDVALSLMRVPWGTKTFFEGIDYWKSLYDLSSDFFKFDSHSYTLRFEDLVESPEYQLRKLCEFLGEKFEYSMLDTSLTGKQVNSQGVPWKKKAEEPIDKNRAYQWKNYLSNEMNYYTEALIGNTLKEFNYPTTQNLPNPGEYYPQNITLHQYGNKLSKMATSGIRFWKKDPSEEPVAIFMIGEPMKLNCVEESLIGKIENVFLTLIKVFQFKLTGKKVVLAYIRRPSSL